MQPVQTVNLALPSRTVCFAMLCCTMQGFMRISRNHGKHGKCALASYPAMVFRQPLPGSSKTHVATA